MGADEKQYTGQKYSIVPLKAENFLQHKLQKKYKIIEI